MALESPLRRAWRALSSSLALLEKILGFPAFSLQPDGATSSVGSSRAGPKPGGGALLPRGRGDRAPGAPGSRQRWEQPRQPRARLASSRACVGPDHALHFCSARRQTSVANPTPVLDGVRNPLNRGVRRTKEMRGTQGKGDRQSDVTQALPWRRGPGREPAEKSGLRARESSNWDTAAPSCPASPLARTVSDSRAGP